MGLLRRIGPAVLAAALQGCSVTSADRAFVEGTSTFVGANLRHLRRGIQLDPRLRGVERQRRHHEVDDYLLLLQANCRRAGVAPVRTESAALDDAEKGR